MVGVISSLVALLQTFFVGFNTNIIAYIVAFYMLREREREGEIVREREREREDPPLQNTACMMCHNNGVLTTNNAEINVPVSPKAFPTSSFEHVPSDVATDVQNRHIELPQHSRYIILIIVF